MANDIRIHVGAKDDASRPIDRVKDSMKGLERQSGPLSGALGRVGGAAKAMAMVGFGAALVAVAGFTAALGAGIKGALDEQAGIERLNTALANNVEGWNGNRDAIEEVIDARTRLAFDDGALRDSLSGLVMRTKDVNEALDLQAIAMDLARAKGIELSTASDIVGKVYSGNTGILSRYGIAVEKGATATQALAAIQEQTAGQAEAYGNTTKGAFEKFNIAMANVWEDVGSSLLPVLTGLATFLSDNLIPLVKDVAARVSEWFEENRELIDGILELTGVIIGAWWDAVTTIIGAIADLITEIGNNEDAMAALRAGIDLVAKAFSLARDAVGFVIGKLGEFVRWITSNEDALNVLRTIADGLKFAFDAVVTTIGVVIGRLQDLANWISQNSGPILDFIRGVSLFVGGGGGAGLANDLFKPQARASGGSVTAGQTYIVGEDGPELLTMGSSGHVTPNGALGGGATINVNVTIAGGIVDPYGDTARRIAESLTPALRTVLNRQGMSLA